jgi:spore germination cell wall hydrolase CwlJ-like protein
MTADDFNERFGSGRAASPVASPAGRPVATAPDRAALQSDNTEPAETRAAATPAPVQLAALPANPLPDEVSKSVEVQLPMPKPPLSPAQRLDLHGKDYDKAEKCLAQAVYFEARNEPARGQQAVAQVVLNRVFSPYYPKDVCSVVYQNAHRHLACQFTFACDGKPDRINERGSWARANRIAMQTLNARVWLPDVNKATHYHATYVRPYWIRDMKTMARYGLHIFYRPRNWGDGADEAHWDTPSNSVKPAAVASKHGVTAGPAKRVSHRRVYRRHYRA